MINKIDRIRGAILREIHNYDTNPLKIAAACAHMALSQSITLGILIGKGELNENDVPTNAPVEVMEMLKDDERALSLFQYVARVLMGLVRALPEKEGLMPYSSVFGIFRLNVGMVEDADLRKIAESIHKDQLSLKHLEGDVVNKITQAAAWFYMFMTYQEAALRLDVKDAQMDKFTEVPQNVTGCLNAIIKSLRA